MAAEDMSTTEDCPTDCSRTVGSGGCVGPTLTIDRGPKAEPSHASTNHQPSYKRGRVLPDGCSTNKPGEAGAVQNAVNSIIILV